MNLFKGSRNILIVSVIAIVIVIVIGVLVYKTKGHPWEKLVFANQSVSTSEFTFYYPNGYEKYDSHNYEVSNIKSELLAYYRDPENWWSSITLEKVTQPIDISSESKCKLIAEGKEIFFYKFVKDQTKTVCVIETHRWVTDANLASIRKYFFKKNSGNTTYMVTTEHVHDPGSEYLPIAAEKFELKD